MQWLHYLHTLHFLHTFILFIIHQFYLLHSFCCNWKVTQDSVGSCLINLINLTMDYVQWRRTLVSDQWRPMVTLVLFIFLFALRWVFLIWDILGLGLGEKIFRPCIKRTACASKHKNYRRNSGGILWQTKTKMAAMAASICIQISKRKYMYIGSNAQNTEKWGADLY